MSGRQVWKFLVWVDGKVHAFCVPGGGRVVHVGEQVGQVMVWVEVQDVQTAPQRMFLTVVGTGSLVPDGGTHVGAALVGSFVWHVYEVARGDDAR